MNKLITAVPAALTVVLTIALVTVLAPDNRAEAAIDMTGKWNWELTTIETCSATVTQIDSALSVDLDCDVSGTTLGITGTIVKATGAFAVDNGTIFLSGITDGLTIMNGIVSWHGCGCAEPLTGTKKVPPPTTTPTPTVTPTPDPTDTDGDGCSDQRENGSDETLGGLRDYLNPWDFYDVETISGPGQDGVVDLLFDILGVINHYQPAAGGAPPYDAHYDRGPSAGPNAWNMTAPDGVIDLLIDILGVINQYDHDCR